MFLSAPITKTLEDVAHLRDWYKLETQVLLYWKKDWTISEQLYHDLVQRRQERGIKCGLTCLVPFTMNSPSYHRAVCVLAWLCVLCYEWKSCWQAEKLKAILVKTTNKWATFLSPRLWHSLLHRASCNSSLSSSITGYCSVCILFSNYLKASVQCEHWQWALQKFRCGTIASS